MRIRILLLMLFIGSTSFSQSLNKYKAVLIPVKYDFLSFENQYRLQTLTKMNLQKAGIAAFYTNENIPSEYDDRCNLLRLDVEKESTFFKTRLKVVFRNCKDSIVFESLPGESREKEFRMAYVEALNGAFESVYKLKYKYEAPAAPVVKEVSVVPVINIDETSEALLYAQPTAFGYQLIDKEPKVVMKVYKTSNPACYIAFKENTQGVLVVKNNQWFFEYYQEENLISEAVLVKF